MERKWETMTNNELATNIKLVEIEFNSKKQKIITLLGELDSLELEHKKGQETLKKRINP